MRKRVYSKVCLRNYRKRGKMIIIVFFLRSNEGEGKGRGGGGGERKCIQKLV